MEIIFSLLIGYILGCFPTAFIILKWKNNKDIREEGSGNVGAMNSYEVSGSPFLGLAVLAVDFFKGFAAVYISKLLFGDVFIYPAAAMISAVFAHCYNPLLKFKGGKGLAAGLGSSVFLAPLIPLVWIVIWLVAFLYKRDINFGNITATLLTLAITIVNGEILNKYGTPPAELDLIFSITASLMLLIILSRHIDDFKVLVKNFKTKKRSYENE